MDEYSQQEPPVQEEAASEAGLFEDLIDVFFNPRELFARRRDGKFWGGLITLVVLSAVLVYAAASAIGPVLQMEAIRLMAANPNVEPGTAPPGFLTNPVLQAGFGAVMTFISMFVLGLFIWAVGRILGGELGYGHGVAIGTFAAFPRLLAPIAEIVQSLFVDLNALTARAQLSLGPARFLDPETSSAVTQAIAGRLDLTVVWATILIGVGYVVTARLTRGKAATGAILIWGVATVLALGGAALSGG
ncbi:MAG: Yip1 family protein [Gemmatimonadota bacterium]